MERLEAWLQDHGISITGQVLTGSGDVVRLSLRLLDGSQLDVVLSGQMLLERPDAAIRLVEEAIERHTDAQRANRNN